jgi:hypothetical protein
MTATMTGVFKWLDKVAMRWTGRERLRRWSRGADDARRGHVWLILGAILHPRAQEDGVDDAAQARSGEDGNG